MRVSAYWLKFLVLASFPLAYGQPKVSIITSVYNGDTFIEAFMKDVTRQTIFSDCELIMINANSPGKEEVVIKKWMARYSNIVYKRLAVDPGIYGVWNKGIGMARAKYIANANLDDRFAPRWLEIFYKALQDNPTVDLVYGAGYRTYYPNVTFEQPFQFRLADPSEFSPQAVLRECLPSFQPMWRKSMHKKHGYFNARYKSAGDLEFWCRAVQGGSVFKKVPGIFGVCYVNPQGLSSLLNKKRLSAIRAEEQEVRDLYQRFLR